MACVGKRYCEKRFYHSESRPRVRTIVNLKTDIWLIDFISAHLLRIIFQRLEILVGVLCVVDRILGVLEINLGASSRAEHEADNTAAERGTRAVEQNLSTSASLPLHSTTFPSTNRTRSRIEIRRTSLPVVSSFSTHFLNPDLHQSRVMPDRNPGKTK